MSRDVCGRTLEEVPRSSPSRRVLWRAKPSLRANGVSGEHQLSQASTPLAGARPGGEMVSRVQAKLVQQDIRERRPNARGAHPDACALLGRARTPQTAHRIPLVGGSSGGVVTSISRNGISAGQQVSTPPAAACQHFSKYL